MLQVQAGEGQRVNISLYLLSSTTSRTTSPAAAAADRGYCSLLAFFSEQPHHNSHHHTEPLCSSHVATVGPSSSRRHVLTSSGRSVSVEFVLNQPLTSARHQHASFLLQLQGQRQRTLVAASALEKRKLTAWCLSTRQFVRPGRGAMFSWSIALFPTVSSPFRPSPAPYNG